MQFVEQLFTAHTVRKFLKCLQAKKPFSNGKTQKLQFWVIT